MLLRNFSLATIVLLALPAVHAGNSSFGNGILSYSAVPGCSDTCGEVMWANPAASPACHAPATDVCGVDLQCGGDGCGEPLCTDLCGEGCGEGCSSLFGDCSGKLLGLFRPSDHCFDNFISPMTNPVFFEDPRTLTEARFIYLNHRIPSTLGGNNVQLLALQLRGAITENLSIIATKDGFAFSDNPLVRDGWADISAGLKLNVYKNVASQTLVSVGTTFEMPTGSPRTLQGNGDGEFNLFVTGGTELATDWHYLMAAGWRLPIDQNAESTSIYLSNHIDRRLGDSGFYLLAESNWYHWTDDGNAFPAAVEGIDLFNLGGRGVDGNDIVTGALGVKYKPSPNVEVGFAWETPLTNRRDILEDRYTVDFILRY